MPAALPLIVFMVEITTLGNVSQVKVIAVVGPEAVMVAAPVLALLHATFSVFEVIVSEVGCVTFTVRVVMQLTLSRIFTV